MDRVCDGLPVYGMNGVGAGHDSQASKLLIAAVDKADARPLWVTVWGGPNVLAQALWSVRALDLSPSLINLLPSCASMRSPIRMIVGLGCGLSFPSCTIFAVQVRAMAGLSSRDLERH